MLWIIKMWLCCLRWHGRGLNTIDKNAFKQRRGEWHPLHTPNEIYWREQATTRLTMRLNAVQNWKMRIVCDAFPDERNLKRGGNKRDAVEG
jgi:hypothetical protein